MVFRVEHRNGSIIAGDRRKCEEASAIYDIHALSERGLSDDWVEGTRSNQTAQSSHRRLLWRPDGAVATTKFTNLINVPGPRVEMSPGGGPGRNCEPDVITQGVEAPKVAKMGMTVGTLQRRPSYGGGSFPARQRRRLREAHHAFGGFFPQRNAFYLCLSFWNAGKRSRKGCIKRGFLIGVIKEERRGQP